VVILVLVEIANDHFRLDRPAFSLAAVGLLVTALSIFLALRVNEAYARWWEARGLWGQLINSSRSFTRQVITLIVAKSEDEASQAEMRALRRELVYRQIAFASTLRLPLRRQEHWGELTPFLGDEEREWLVQTVNKPTQILQRQGLRLAEASAAGYLSEIGQIQMDRTLSTLHDVQGACERIKTTAFPDNVA
jgi:putative membrane protein